MKTVIDISYYQKPENINYNLLMQNLDGIILRSSYGTGASGWRDQPDPAFNIHYLNAKEFGKPIGAYHYLVEYKTVDEQIAIVKRALDGKNVVVPVWDGNKFVMKPGFWADIELEYNAPALTRSTVIEFITKSMQFTNVGIYSSAHYWNMIMGSDNPFSELALWVAHYTTASSPYLPYGWSDWWLWQYTSSGRLPGYDSSLDMNRCTDEKWEAWTGYTPPIIINPMNIEPLSQKDARWVNEKLGTSSVTIGAYGCLLTCAAMVANYFGKNTNPSQLNKDLIRVNGYESGNLLKWGSIETIYPDISVNWNYFLANPDDALIDEVLVQELPVFVQVDYNTNTPALDQHWVLVVGKEGNDYLIVDPIDGSTAYLSRYAGKAWRIAVYEQYETEEPLFKVEVICGALNVRSTPVYLPDGSNKVDLLNNGEVVNVYEIADNGWYRIGKDRWISGHSDYTKKIEIEPPPPPLTIEERVKILEDDMEVVKEKLEI